MTDSPFCALVRPDGAQFWLPSYYYHSCLPMWSLLCLSPRVQIQFETREVSGVSRLYHWVCETTLRDVVAPPKSTKLAETVAELVPMDDMAILGCLDTDCL